MPMIRDVCHRPLGLALYALALTIWSCGLPAAAQQSASKEVSVKLVCGSHSANPKELRPFEEHLKFNVTDSLWVSERTTGPEPGKERFLGILSPSSGTMLIIGERRLVVEGGKLGDRPIWTYEFSGRKSPNGLTILKGRLQTEVPKGTRSCSLGF
jgi:hypothetical protein